MKVALLCLALLAGCARNSTLGTGGTGGTAMGGGGGGATGGSTGGSMGATGGSGGMADAAPCPPECLRAVRCVSSCGSTPISVGCCPCTPPAFDDIKCQQQGMTFESFRESNGYGPCPPNMDCSSFIELQASGLLRVDCPQQLPVVVHEAMVSAAERDAAVAVLTDPALVALLDLGQPPCQPPTDVGETMTLMAGGRKHENMVTFCKQAPIEAARQALNKLAQKYLISQCPTR